jgi:hypothetical protein
MRKPLFACLLASILWSMMILFPRQNSSTDFPVLFAANKFSATIVKMATAGDRQQVHNERRNRTIHRGFTLKIPVVTYVDSKTGCHQLEIESQENVVKQVRELAKDGRSVSRATLVERCSFQTTQSPCLELLATERLHERRVTHDYKHTDEDTIDAPEIYFALHSLELIYVSTSQNISSGNTAGNSILTAFLDSRLGSPSAWFNFSVLTADPDMDFSVLELDTRKDKGDAFREFEFQDPTLFRKKKTNPTRTTASACIPGSIRDVYRPHYGPHYGPHRPQGLSNFSKGLSGLYKNNAKGTFGDIMFISAVVPPEMDVQELAIKRLELGQPGLKERFWFEASMYKQMWLIDVAPKLHNIWTCRHHMKKRARKRTIEDHLALDHQKKKEPVVFGYMLSEKLQGSVEKLDEQYQENKPLIDSVVAALIIALEHGFVHNDFHAKNWGIDKNGFVKLIDFALAAHIQSLRDEAKLILLSAELQSSLIVSETMKLRRVEMLQDLVNNILAFAVPWGELLAKARKDIKNRSDPRISIMNK